MLKKKEEKTKVPVTDPLISVCVTLTRITARVTPLSAGSGSMTLLLLFRGAVISVPAGTSCGSSPRRCCQHT